MPGIDSLQRLLVGASRAYARGTHPDALVALTANIDDSDVRQLMETQAP